MNLWPGTATLPGMRISLAQLVVLSFLANGRLGNAAENSGTQSNLVAFDASPMQWPAPTPQTLAPGSPSVHSKELELVHSRDRLGGFVVRVAGEPMAIGQDRPQIGFVSGGELRWLDLAGAAGCKLTVRPERNSIGVNFTCQDGDGVRWEIAQNFSVAAVPGAINIKTQLAVQRDRSVAFVPMFMVFPGAGTLGAGKGQGLFAGLEYLENEPSSSEADVVGPASKRQVPDTLKITFPLMAIQNEGRYLALTWQPEPRFGAVFDSPDRLFGSGGHVMGLIFPGCDGKNRAEGNLLPRAGHLLRAKEPLVLQATLLGGLGQSLAPAVAQYVSLDGLPRLPEAKTDVQQYVSLAAVGWLDSSIREGNLFRHAVAPNFALGPAADAAVWMDWLASQAGPPELLGRLREAAKAALAPIAPQNLDATGIGHVRYPVASLIYGHVAENAAHSSQVGHQLLGSFDKDGSARYHARPGGPDFARTHYTNEANGLTARVVADLLEAAAFSGERELLVSGLERLRAMDKFRNGVPRGAQTWECPLHTPDILAAANLVRAYTLGYELSGERDFLEQARYWAWTGVPFVYLVNPAPGPVGPYATIAVFGATQWRAPVWLGLPVQWCGLVYAEALYRLARDDPNGPWKRLADGITLSGMEQCWPASHSAQRGLLPDSYVLRAQRRNGPAINPATLQACAAHLFGKPVYDFWAFRQNGLRVHAPGAINSVKEKAGRVSFQIETWLDRPYQVLINGLTHKPLIRINGARADGRGHQQFLEKEGWLILELEGNARVELSMTKDGGK